ncbi:MAG: hypothetical protein QMD14_00235 [Candidatus Aenigmarchaeota archaeon]|nr:hypothetical protein [Candidatus Aenigmarchaeota archaeon]
MPEELGKIEKPAVEEFKLGRKLYHVPLVYLGKDSPPEYKEKFERYWNDVPDHVNNLEKAGLVKKIYHESISLAGEEGLKLIEKLNEKSYQLVKSKCEQGAELEALEDQDLINEIVDWRRILLIEFLSERARKEVGEKVFGFYQEAVKRRYETLAKRIDETLKDGEAGMLLMRDDERIQVQPQLPSDITVFLVHPPAFEEINRWLRDRPTQKSEEKGGQKWN